MATPLLLQAEHVAKAYAGVPALRDGRLSLRAGSVHALCGGNGAGKSTFLSILMGITQRDAGSIVLNGAPVQFNRPSEALAAGIAMITQELEPIPYMTVAENIWLGREPRRAAHGAPRALGRPAAVSFAFLARACVHTSAVHPLVPRARRMTDANASAARPTAVTPRAVFSCAPPPFSPSPPPARSRFARCALRRDRRRRRRL